MSLRAYQAARNVSENPRATEYRLMSQVTGALIDARMRNLSGSALAHVLHWNREVWSTFANLCSDADNQLPHSLRAGIISLWLFVDRHSSEIMSGTEGHGIEDLIDINRTIMEGLSALDGG